MLFSTIFKLQSQVKHISLDDILSRDMYLERGVIIDPVVTVQLFFRHLFSIY